jgi:hypothetical protein
MNIEIKKLFMIGFITLIITLGLFYFFSTESKPEEIEIQNLQQLKGFFYILFRKIIQVYKIFTTRAYKLSNDAEKKQNVLIDKIKLTEKEAEILENTINKWNNEEKKDHLKVIYKIKYRL